MIKIGEFDCHRARALQLSIINIIEHAARDAPLDHQQYRRDQHCTGNKNGKKYFGLNTHAKTLTAKKRGREKVKVRISVSLNGRCSYERSFYSCCLHNCAAEEFATALFRNSRLRVASEGRLHVAGAQEAEHTSRM